MCTDGTGSIAKKIKLPNNNYSSHIFLYQILVDVNGKSVPICQMLSTSHSTVAIQSWFFQFRATGCLENKNYPYPEEVVTDFDKALLGAAARAFVEVKSLMFYLSMCFDIIQGIATDIPHTILRLDVCHFTKMIAYWNCYPKQQPGVKATYLRSMCILRKQESFKDFEEMVIQILTLALCRSGNKGSHSLRAKEFLKLKIRGLSDKLTENLLKNDSESLESVEEKNIILDEDEEVFIQSTSLGKWVENIYNEVLEKAKNENVTHDDEVNGYYLPKFAKKLKNFLIYFPIFSESFRELIGFGTVNPSTSAIESYFNDLKNRVFKSTGLPLRLDKFVVLHLKEIEKKLKEAATGALTITKSEEIEAVLKTSCKRKKKLLEDKNQLKKQKFDNFIKKSSFDNASTVELTNEHNWRNKNKKINPIEEDVEVSSEDSEIENASNSMESGYCDQKETKRDEVDSLDNDIRKDISNFKELQICLEKNKTKKQKGAQYGEYCPQFEPSFNYYTYLPILRNGSCCKNVREHSVLTVVSNSCAIDSLVSIISMVILTDEYYKMLSNELEVDIFSLAKMYIEYKLSADVYNERARILRNSSATIKEVKQYEKDLKRSKSTISIVTINALCNITELTNNLFSAAPSYSIFYTCPLCNKIIEDTFILTHVDLQVIRNCGISNLLRALRISQRKGKICCSEIMDQRIVYGPHLLISVEVGRKNETRICDIPELLKLEEETEYKIAGFVNYSGSYDVLIPGHYTGYVVAGKTWLLYDDLSSSKLTQKIVDNEKIVDPHVLLYTKNGLSLSI